MLSLQISVGDGVGDFRRKLWIFGQKIDGDDARLLQRRDREPVVIRIKNALLRRHGHRVFDEAERAEDRLKRRNTFQGRIKLREFVELELGDHLARQIARHDDLCLAMATNRFVDIAVAIAEVLIDVGPHEDVVPPLDQDARLGIIFGRDQFNGDQT